MSRTNVLSTATVNYLELIANGSLRSEPCRCGVRISPDGPG